MRKKRSIIGFLYSHMLAVFAFILIMFLVVNVVAVNVLSTQARRGGLMVSKAVTVLIADRAHGIENMLRDLQHIKQSDGLSNAQMDVYLNEVTKDFADIKAIEIVNKDGIVVNSAPLDNDVVGMDRSRESYMQALDELESLYWSPIFTYMRTGNPVVAASLRSNDYFYVVYVDLAMLTEITHKLGAAAVTKMELDVLDEYGTYITHSDSTQVYQRATSKELNLIKESIQNKSYSFESNANGAIVNTSYIPAFRWYVATYSNKEYVLQAVRLINWLFYVVFVALGVLTFVYYLRTRKISRSLAGFTQTADAVASGNYKLNIRAQEFAELDTLGASLGAMGHELEKHTLQLQEQARVDVLTGLPNRRAAMEKLDELIMAGSPFTLFYFDLDRFKDLNDKYGHNVGDELLNIVGKRILNSVVHEDNLCRVGGDEFIYILPTRGKTRDFTGLSQIMAEINKPIKIEEGLLYVGASAGSASFPDDAQTIEDLLKYSDMAMYQAKNAGGNQIQRFDKEMHVDFLRKSDIEAKLFNEDYDRFLSFDLQPQYHIDKGSILGFEILARWHDEALGYVSPVEFIPIAENRGRIHKVTMWMFNRALETLAMLSDRYGNEFKMSVNISANDLQHPGILDEFLDVITLHGLDASHIEVEITEDVMIEKFDLIHPTLAGLSESGIRIALDDFGKGYSSLSYLNEMKVDTLKIDKRFLDSACLTDKGRKLFKTIVDMAADIGSEVIVEGVETAEQLEMLKSMSCFGVQGYYLARPMPLNDLLDYLDGIYGRPD